jgi:hypothetical protein
MSLTIIIDTKMDIVGVVRWFKDPTYSIEYPCGPLLEHSLDEFRKLGVDIVRKHFQEYKIRKLHWKDAIPVFASDNEERRYLRKKLAICVDKSITTADVKLTPMCFSSYILGGLHEIKTGLFRKLPSAFTHSQFWDAFDAVMGELQ